MALREILKRHHLIIRKLQSCPASFEEIMRYLKQCSDDNDLTITQRTFQRDIRDIEQVYGIRIKFNKYDGKYHIIQEESFPDDTGEKILQILDFKYILGKHELYGKYVLFDRTPTHGISYLYDILESIRKRKMISFDYYNVWEDSIKKRVVKPLGLKEFKQRWYLIAIEAKTEKIKHFALDRMSKLSVTTAKYQYPENFSFEKHFENYYGITVLSDTKPEEVVLLFEPHQAEYVRTFPLHHSQIIEKEEDKEGRMLIRLNLCITYEFIMEILSYGPDVKVLKPDYLAQGIVNMLKETMLLYKK